MEGGLILTDDEEIYHILLSIRAHGWTRNLPENNLICKKSEDPFYESFRFILPGYNVRPLELSGALGIEQIKKLDDGGGVTNFGAISLTQIPGDPDSIKGSKARGVYWTKPDKSGKEVSRDVDIDESKYSEFIRDYENTYFKEVYDVLSSKYKLGRVRILLKEPRSTLSWHRDPEPRLHIPIITNPGCLMVIDNVAKHMPADGSVWVTNNTKYHNAFNGGEENRIHLVACVLDYKFN